MFNQLLGGSKGVQLRAPITSLGTIRLNSHMTTIEAYEPVRKGEAALAYEPVRIKPLPCPGVNRQHGLAANYQYLLQGYYAASRDTA